MTTTPAASDTDPGQHARAVAQAGRVSAVADRADVARLPTLPRAPRPSPHGRP